MVSDLMEQEMRKFQLREWNDPEDAWEKNFLKRINHKTQGIKYQARVPAYFISLGFLYPNRYDSNVHKDDKEKEYKVFYTTFYNKMLSESILHQFKLFCNRKEKIGIYCWFFFPFFLKFIRNRQKKSEFLSFFWKTVCDVFLFLL